jgi:uncharacterized RDD family membrane protein YckC
MPSKYEPCTVDKAKSERPGGVFPRLIAQFVDIVITIFTLLLLIFLRNLFFGTDKQIASDELSIFDFGFFVLLMLLPVSYYSYFYRRYGATPGKRLMKLSVRDQSSGRNIGLAQTVTREVIGKWILGLGLPSLILMMIRKDRRAIHDLLGRTVVFDTRSYEG